jgi:hypothetical protein
MKKTLFLIIPALLLFSCANNSLKVSVANTTGLVRTNETIEIPVTEITSGLPDVNLHEIIVTDRSGKEIPSQLIFEGEATAVKLIFQATVAANSSTLYTIKKGIPQKYETRVYGRFVPERMDDYAWENDRIAFRIYGTALIQKDGPSNGLDIWVKRTDRMVINKWYSEYLAGKNSYHDDNGEGCDCYKVGRTLGAGAMAPYINDSLWLGINFESYKTLDNGPVRTSFSLSYPPFLSNGVMITEKRTFSLDAGCQLNSVTEEYTGTDEPFAVVAGIVKRDEGKVLVCSPEKGYITYSLKDGLSGIIYIGTVLKTASSGVIETKDHLLIKTGYKPNEKLTYYTGAGWSKWGFENEESWVKYIDEFSTKLNNPLKVTFK